jgi:hypothetical protein
VAMVLDRILLWVFSFACVSGTCGIILVAPRFLASAVSSEPCSEPCHAVRSEPCSAQ